MQGVLKGGGGDEAVTAVATNNWVAERLLAEGGDPAPPKKLCADLLRKLEAFFDKVTSLNAQFLCVNHHQLLVYCMYMGFTTPASVPPSPQGAPKVKRQLAHIDRRWELRRARGCR